jgi:tricorn protease
MLTSNVGEDRDPRYLPGYQDVVFLSERNNGSFNVYKASAKNMEQVEAVTHFTTHPVRFLSVANDGLLCYGYMGEIYTQRIGSEPQKVNIEIVNDLATDQKVKEDFKGAGNFSLSSDGKLIAFVSRGEVFVTGVDEYATTKQITHTPQAERSPSFSKDGRTLVYASERDGYWNLYQATIVRKDDYNFAYATLIDEKPLFDNDGIERSNPDYSPDGKEIAFIENRNILKVYNVASKEVRQITDGTQHYGSMGYEWSPDGKWFAVTLITHMRDPYSDVGIVSANGDKKIYNITESAYFDDDPQWVLDGSAIIYNSDRYGMRSHASWGSQRDAFIAFLNQDAYDRFRLSKEEYALLKETEKGKKDDKKEEPKKEEKDNKKGKKDNKKNDKKDGSSTGSETSKDDKEAKAMEVDLEHLQDRIIRLTPMSSNLSGMALSKDGDKLYFMTSFEKGYDLWELDVREKSMKILKKMGQGGARLAVNGDNIFLLSGNNLQKVDKSGKSTSIKFDATMELDFAAEREYMFNHVFLQIEKRFFMKDHHGVDLELMKNAYQPFLAHINNNYDFTEMLSEILGELNVSHTGSGYRPSGRDGDATAEFGVLLDLDYKGDGLKIAEVVEGGPFDKGKSKVKAGCIIEKIDGVEITKGMDYYPLLNNKSGKTVLVTLKEGGKTWEETVKPISHGAMNELLYNRWVKHNEETVKRLSNGRLGYVHIRSMGDASYRDVYSQILGKYNLCDGIVIDTRFNGGGRLHEDIEILFSGEKYLEQVINDSVACVMPSRRYNKPSIMIIGEANYSNAHGTPWVYKHKHMGSLVGMPVPGTMSSVTWETLQDPSMYFGLPVVGYRTEQGNWLENTQLEPDFKVRNTPEKMAEGVDEQLEAAVDELLKELKDFHYWGK